MPNKNFTIAVGLVIGSGAVATDATAGFREPTSPAVTITRDAVQPSRITVRGSLGAAHNSSNSSVFIQCRIRGYGDDAAGNATYSGECRAHNGSSEAYCWVHDGDLELLKAIVSVNGSSHVEFKYDETPGSEHTRRCSEITVENSSKYVAKDTSVRAADKREVTIASDATGALGSARNSQDSTQRIGCSIYTDPSWKEATCSATSSTGATAECSTSRSNFLFALMALKPDSYLEFPDADGEECGRIEIVNSSRWRASY